MHHALEGVPEALGDFLQLAQREVALVELAVEDALLDDVVDELVDPLRRDALEAARGALDGVGEADDGAFAALRRGPG